MVEMAHHLKKEKAQVHKSKLKLLIPGITLVMIIAYISVLIGKEIPTLGSTVTAILFGILLRNFMTIPLVFEEGIAYSIKKVLKYAIILLGINLNLWQVLTIGSKSLGVIIIVVAIGILLTLYMGKLLKVTGNTPLLIGVGTAICGATAIATVSPVLKAKEEETTIAISTIFIFNVLAVILYPLIGLVSGMNNEFFGTWVGLSIHDTSSVVAAGYIYSNEAGEFATVVKLTRTLFLIPVAVILGIYISRKNTQDGKSDVKISKIFPWFLLGFLGMSILNTLNVFSEYVTVQLTDISKFMVLMAMASVGLGANFSEIRKVGIKPVYIGLSASIVVALISIFLTYLIV